MGRKAKKETPIRVRTTPRGRRGTQCGEELQQFFTCMAVRSHTITKHDDAFFNTSIEYLCRKLAPMWTLPVPKKLLLLGCVQLQRYVFSIPPPTCEPDLWRCMHLLPSKAWGSSSSSRPRPNWGEETNNEGLMHLLLWFYDLKIYMQAKKPRVINTINYHLQRISRLMR